ncbi:DUF4340 domain-containing protein [Pseudomonadota bacterium]
MRPHLLTNLFLLLLAIALGTFLFVDEIDQNGTGKLSHISADSINQISIHHKQRDVIIEKHDQQWRLIEPIEIHANQFRIKTLLNILNTNSYVQYETEKLDLDKYGLDKANTYIQFNDTRIDFGITNPINSYRYVKINNTLHLTDDHFYPLLSSQTGTLIARELLPAGAKVNKLILPEHTFMRDDNGLWKSDKDISSDAIVELIHQWKHKQAFSVHDYMERESLGEIQVYLENRPTPINYSITDSEPWLIIARPDIKLEYHFNIEDYDALLRPGAPKQIPEDIENNLENETLQVSPDEFIDAIQAK